MSDRELLFLTANALGWIAKWDSDLAEVVIPDENGCVGDEWNPLIDTGDAMRVLIALRLAVSFGAGCSHPLHSVLVWKGLTDNMTASAEVTFDLAADEERAVRRAIVMVAAELGKDK